MMKFRGRRQRSHDIGPARRVGPGRERRERCRQGRVHGRAVAWYGRHTVRRQIGDVGSWQGGSEGRHGRQGQEHVAQMVRAGQQDSYA